ncbi:MAG: hypothetical protein MJZ20_10885 [Bacteroidaceae bacterium]|nr:hypothetical protein [Bacteroidaceae bacterium]
MKHKFLVSLVLCTLMMTSCTSVYHYLQVVKVQPTTETSKFTANSHGFEYHNEDLAMIYNVWSENGKTSFYIYNRSNEILYVDLAKSFFIKDGAAYNYYEEMTYSETVSSNIINTSSASYGGMLMASRSTSASASNTYLGKFGVLPISSYDPIASSISLSASRSASAGIYTNASNSFSVATGKASSVTKKVQQIIAIPPMSGKYIDAFQIANAHMLDCDLINYPSDKASITYNEEDSPINFANYITYKIGDNSENKTLRHEFYISEITNYVKPNIITYEKREKPCDAILTPTERKFADVDVYDAYVSIPTDGCFYSTYDITSHDKLYKVSNYSPYYWSSQYNGYTKSQEDPNKYSFNVPQMEK